jgi:hypothetical protein
VDPVPDPLLRRKSASAGNRTRDLCLEPGTLTTRQQIPLAQDMKNGAFRMYNIWMISPLDEPRFSRTPFRVVRIPTTMVECLVL